MKNTNRSWLRHTTTFALMLSLFVGSSTFVLAVSNSSLSGEISVSSLNGSAPVVTLNGENAMNGRTFISNGVIATDAASSATVNLGKLGMVTLSPNTTLDLSLAENSISGNLSSGNVRVMNAEGVAVKINTPDNVVTGKTVSSDVSVDVTSGVTSATGEVEMANGQPAAAQMSKTKRNLIVLGVIGAIATTAIIIWWINNDNDVVSPVR